MSTHRRPAPRGEAPPSRRRSAPDRRRRRATPRTHRLLPVLLGVAMLGIGGVVGPSVINGSWSGDDTGRDGERITYAAKPADNPGLGLVYFGLLARELPGTRSSVSPGTSSVHRRTASRSSSRFASSSTTVAVPESRSASTDRAG